ncbi:MAG TPA: cyclic nucleotide-binding domain-containing protein [Acidothermaceae bacterium]|jgi:CRP-like cAMP-binding protein|nr:cyclic nucleotide-binding domain-containing protein [Acidothermaceae bacterium]
MKDVTQLLAEQPLFSDLGNDMFALVAGCAHNEHFGADDYLFRIGDPADRFYLVRRGLVALELVRTGGSRLIVDTVSNGGIVGLSWLVPPYRWNLDARAVEATSAVSIDAGCLRRKCEDEPRIGYVLLQRVSSALYQRMQAARVRMADVYGVPSDE